MSLPLRNQKHFDKHCGDFLFIALDMVIFYFLDGGYIYI